MRPQELASVGLKNKERNQLSQPSKGRSPVGEGVRSDTAIARTEMQTRREQGRSALMPLFLTSDLLLFCLLAEPNYRWGN